MLAREGEKDKEKDEVFIFKFRMKSSSVERDEFSVVALMIDRDSAFRIGVGRSFHQPGMVNENVRESDFEPPCDGTTRPDLSDVV